MSRFNNRLVTVEFFDGGSDSMVVGPGPGDFTMNNIEAGNSEVLEARDRHLHDGLFLGDELVQEWSITVQLRNETRTDLVEDRVNDWVRQTGKVLANNYISLDGCVWAFGLRITESDGTVTVITELPKCRANYSFAVAKEGNTLSITGRNFLAPVIT